jgi:Sortase domain
MNRIRIRRLALGVLALVVAGGAVLTTTAALHHGTPAAAPLPSAGLDIARTVAPSTSVPTAGPSPSASTASAKPVPTVQRDLGASSIHIPALAVTATVGQATVIRGVLTPPRVPTEVGLWSGSAALDATTGETTIAGHVDWAGMAPFAFGRLAYLHPGDLIYTTDSLAIQTVWRITEVTARPKGKPIDAAAFAGPTGPRMLALITCGGAFDANTKSYVDNVYVTATPAD